MIVVGLPSGSHTVELALVDANHKPLGRKTVAFVVPTIQTAASHR